MRTQLFCLFFRQNDYQTLKKFRSREHSICSFDPHEREILQRGAFFQQHVNLLALPDGSRVRGLGGRHYRRASMGQIEVPHGVIPGHIAVGRRQRTVSMSPPVGALWMGV